MADENDISASNPGNIDDQIEAASSLHEGRLLLEAGRIGIETLAARPTPATAAELSVVLKLLQQAGDALESAQQALQRLLGIEVGHAPDGSLSRSTAPHPSGARRSQSRAHHGTGGTGCRGRCKRDAAPVVGITKGRFEMGRPLQSCSSAYASVAHVYGLAYGLNGKKLRKLKDINDIWRRRSPTQLGFAPLSPTSTLGLALTAGKLADAPARSSPTCRWST
jgi:hypothetical protein